MQLGCQCTNKNRRKKTRFGAPIATLLYFTKNKITCISKLDELVLTVGTEEVGHDSVTTDIAIAKKKTNINIHI